MFGVVGRPPTMLPPPNMVLLTFITELVTTGREDRAPSVLLLLLRPSLALSIRVGLHEKWNNSGQQSVVDHQPDMLTLGAQLGPLATASRVVKGPSGASTAAHLVCWSPSTASHSAVLLRSQRMLEGAALESE